MQLKYIQETLVFISKNGYETNHAKFLKSTAAFLAKLFGANYVLIDKFSIKTPTVTETIVFYSKGEFLPNIPYELENTPCKNVINNKVCSYPINVNDVFPKDDFLAQNNIESYIGIPLWSSSKGPIGLIAIMDDKPKSAKEIDTITTVLEIIAIKVEKVLEKILLEDQLNFKIEELKVAKETAEKSEEKFKNLADLSFEGILIHDMGVVIDFNASFSKMFGYQREDLVGKDITKIIYSENYHKIVSKNRNNNYTFPYEVEGIRTDGSIFPVEIEARNISLENNKTFRVTAYRDITERKKAEFENKKLLAAIEQSANTIFITDVYGNIEYTNPKFTKITGYTAEEALGKNPRFLSSGIQSLEFYKELWETIFSGHIWTGEFQNKAKNGNLYWERTTITPIKNEAGKISSYLAIKEDISKNKEAEENLLQANEEMEKSEKKFRELFEKSGDAILIIKNGVFVECNKKALDMLGYKKYEDVLNLDPSELSPELQPDGTTSLKKAEEMMNASLKKGTNRFEWWHIKSNGTSFPVEVLLTTIENEPNNKVIHCVWRDITNRKIAEQELLKQNKEYRILSDDYLTQNTALQQLSNELSEKNKLLLETKQRFENLFEHSPVSLWEQDFSEVIKLLNEKQVENVNLRTYFDKNPNFINQCLSKIKILNVNKITFDLLGVKNVNELKTLLTKTNNKKSLEIVKEEMLSIASNNKIFTGETEFTSTSGKSISAIVTSAIIDDYGKAIASVIDITELKKAEVELKKAKEKAEESDRLKTEFIQNMSHEIRTPMNGILGFSELLDNPELPDEKRKRFIEIIKNSTHQLLHIIDDIMEISVLETKQIKAEEEPVCLNDLLHDLFAVFDIKARIKNTVMSLKNGLSDQESTILTDKNKLNKVLSNLMENALKFTTKGTVELGYKIKDKEIEIYVKDSGIGIKPEKQKMIFERFSQAEKELSKKVGGLGLGLSIAKENAELLGGKISVVSLLGEGAAFFVTIPYKPVNLFPKIEKEEKTGSETKEKYTILVAEDEDINFMVLEILLVDKIKLPCNIIHAKDGLEAVELCKNNEDIEFVLMDIKMPKMDGHEATRLIKQMRPNLPIIAQTAYSSPEEKEKAFFAGCNDFISKPISKESVIAVLNHYLLAGKDNDVPHT